MVPHVRVLPGARRAPALAGVAALLATPLLATPWPAAAVAASSTETVTFVGGCSLLGGSGPSPDVTYLRVPADAEVRFVNDTSQDADLWVDGESAGEVPEGGAVTLTFRPGAATVDLQITCLLGSRTGSVTVEAGRVTPTSADAGVHEAPPAADGSAAGDDRAAPATGDGRERPGARSAPPSAPDHDGDTVPGGSGADDERGRDDETGAPPSPRPTADQSPRMSGDPGADAPLVTLEPPTDGSTELSRTARADRGEGTVGLLALIATVCVVGVSAGAIRTLLNQRGNPPIRS